MMRKALILAATVLSTSAAFAEEPVGCDKFKWPIDQARTALTASNITQLQTGDNLAAPPSAAILGLRPLGDANLPKEPERDQKPESFAGFVNVASPPAEAKLPMTPERTPRSTDGKAGFVRVAAPPQNGAYRITLSAGGWIDVIQDNRFVKSGAFSGATGCEGVRKSVTFDLAASPLVVQFSSVPAGVIGMVMTPVAP